MNTKKIATITGILLSVLIVITAVVWTLAYRERPQPAQFAMLIDYSDSRTINCAAIDTIIGEIMLSPNLMSGSNLYFFSTGDDKSSDEPVLLEKYKIPVNIKVLEGKSKAGRERQEFIKRIKTRCEQEPIKKRSPILLGLKRVIENLKVDGCNAQAGCKVFVQTDGQELSETAVKKSLTDKTKPNSAPQVSIQNDGIGIKICGFAQVSEPVTQKNRHSIQTAEQTITIWKQVFTHPNLVLFPPHCQ